MRAGYYTNPSEKKAEVYVDFSQGLNTEFANHALGDNELTELLNVDLGERGILKKRHGFSSLSAAVGSGLSQGFWFFYKDSVRQTIFAHDGNLYKENGTVIPITGLTNGFQKTRPIQAVQFQQKLYIATGTKLVVYDGTTAKVVEPLAPQPLEALYIGTNALSDNPDNFMSDGEALSLRIDGVTFDKRYGILNKPFTMTAYISKPADKQVEFMFEWRYNGQADGKWTTGQNWSSKKTYTLTPTVATDLQFRVNMREKGLQTAEAQYLIPKYKVKAAPDPEDDKGNVATIHTCNRIVVHWNRLLMYGDPTNPSVLYISELNKPNYFPVPNTLIFENDPGLGITSLVKFRDSIVVFTPTSIQALYGKSPADYRRSVLNTSIGCIAPDSAIVVENYIYFLSKEGIFYLKSLGYVEDKANVARLDEKIRSQVLNDTDATALYHDGQYMITFPSSKVRLRLYPQGAWVKDTSAELDLSFYQSLDGMFYGMKKTGGALVKENFTLFVDGNSVYEMLVTTKAFDFSEPYHTKKLKELQLLMAKPKNNPEVLKARVAVTADGNLVVDPTEEFASVDNKGNVVWNIQEVYNVNIDPGAVLGQWKLGQSKFGQVAEAVTVLRLSGKCRTSGISVSYKGNQPLQFYGLAYVFKLKRM